MSKLRLVGLSLAIGLTVASCGTTKKAVDQVSTKTEQGVKEPTALPQKFRTVYKDKDLQNWQHTNPFDSHYPGMSTEKAYAELLKDKPAKTIIVAVIDAGMDINHPDLKPIIWVNKDEIPGNGIDDDHNGYVDDIHGWNFLGAKDGKMAGPEQLELTRIVAKYRPMWKDKTVADIPAEKREMFNMYQRAEKVLAKKLADIKPLEAKYNRYAKMAENVESTLKAALKTDKLTNEAVKALKSDDVKVRQAKSMYLQGLSLEALSGFKHYVEGQVKYNLNVDFNGRVQGDDPDDFNDRDYGNPNVIPPEADELHATHVGGIIAQLRHNGIGGDGVADHVLIMPVRTVPDGDEYDKDVALADALKPTIGSNTRKLSINCIKVTKIASGMRYGITTWRICCQREAPSNTEASSVSSGTVCSPA